MNKKLQGGVGIQALLEKYKKIFRIPENLQYYSEKDYKIAERKFLKYALIGSKTLLPQNYKEWGGVVGS